MTECGSWCSYRLIDNLLLASHLLHESGVYDQFRQVHDRRTQIISPLSRLNAVVGIENVQIWCVLAEIVAWLLLLLPLILLTLFLMNRRSWDICKSSRFLVIAFIIIDHLVVVITVWRRSLTGVCAWLMTVFVLNNLTKIQFSEGLLAIFEFAGSKRLGCKHVFFLIRYSLVLQHDLLIVHNDRVSLSMPRTGLQVGKSQLLRVVVQNLMGELVVISEWSYLIVILTDLTVFLCVYVIRLLLLSFVLIIECSLRIHNYVLGILARLLHFLNLPVAFLKLDVDLLLLI